MSDTSAFIAGCATTGAAALMLVLARMGIQDTASPVSLEPPPALTEDVVPVPAPPPGLTLDVTAQQELVEALAQQQTLTASLEDMLAQQQVLVRDLERKVQEQQAEALVLATRLDAYEQSVSLLTNQQQALVGNQHSSDRTQASILWVGAGLVLVVLVGGAVVLLILVVLVAFQARKSRSDMPPIVYTPDIAPPSYPYYQQEFLPPPRRPRRVQPQDAYYYE